MLNFLFRLLPKCLFMRKLVTYVGLLICIGLCPFSVLAQGVTISGTIRSTASGDVVPAVTVTVKGTSAGTFTNDRGYFRISVPGHFPLTLVVSSVGFATKEIPVSSADAVSVNLDRKSVV